MEERRTRARLTQMSGVLGAAALVGGTGTTYPIYWQERPDREHAFNMSVVYGCLAALLVAFGFLVDYLLS